MNTKPNLSKRISRPQSLGAAFGGLMKIFGARASDADLAENWEHVVGADLARLAKLSGTRKVGAGSARPKQFNITLKPSVPAMATELSYRTEEFRIKINKYFGYDAVGKITVKM